MMNTLMSLGDCLLTIILFFIVALGVWRAWKPKAPEADMSSTPLPTTDDETLVLGTDTTPIPEELVPLDISEQPTYSAYLGDERIAVLLAMQRKERGGKYRFSANQIYTLLKGNHKQVLDLIAELRGEKPEYVSDLRDRVQSEIANEERTTRTTGDATH